MCLHWNGEQAGMSQRTTVSCARVGGEGVAKQANVREGCILEQGVCFVAFGFEGGIALRAHAVLRYVEGHTRIVLWPALHPDVLQ